MQRIVLIGASGQIGQALKRQWSHRLSGHDHLYCPRRAEVDLTNPVQLQAWLDRYQPTVIINAAAYTAVDQAEHEHALVDHINHLAVKQLAHWAAIHHARLLHYSTDYVFDGSRPIHTAYTETDLPCPINQYGRSKYAAEQAIVSAGCRALILRTSWVYAEQGRNFVNTILQLARQREGLSVVDDQIGVPNHATRIAQNTLSILDDWLAQPVPAQAQIYHLSAAGHTSWYGVAQRVLTLAAHHESLRCTVDQLQPITTLDYPTPARRPRNSRLATDQIRQHFAVELPDWSVDLEQMLRQRPQGASACK